MLAQFVLLIWALLAISALAIDMGFVTLTRNEMQTAADSAALEGLRQRDALGDALRRNAAAGFVTQTFSEPDPNSDRQPGAGPDFTLTGGVTDLNALQTLSVPHPPNPYVYEPALKTNAENQPYGDMVSGCWKNPPPGAFAQENSDYARNDFDPAATPAAGPCPADIAAAPSFLVRLRRSISGDVNRDNPLDIDATHSSAGKTLPLLFGLGTTVHGDPETSTYSPHVHGITVRATAIANTRPALRVGIADAAHALPGAAPFVLARTSWEGLAAGTYTITADDAGADGFLTASPRTTVGQVAAGQAATLTSTGDCTNCVPGFVPVYQSISGNLVIVGFGAMKWAGVSPGLFVMIRTNSQVAVNATAHLAGGIPVPAGFSPADLNTLIADNLSLDGAVLVPVLAR
jgi:hypothetical protein